MPRVGKWQEQTSTGEVTWTQAGSMKLRAPGSFKSLMIASKIYFILNKNCLCSPDASLPWPNCLKKT